MTSSSGLARPLQPSASRRCAPGEWYAVLAAGATVLLPPGARDRVAATWDLADRGAGFDELLDQVLADGLRALPGLALVGDLDDGRVRVLLRGPVRARVGRPGGGSRLLRAEAESWSDRSLEEVSSLSLAVDGATAGPEIAVTTGIARVGSLRLGDVTPQSRRLGPVPAAGPRAVPRPRAEGPARPTLRLASGPATAATSSVATLVFSTGAVVPVDRSVVVGRAPRGSGCGVSAAEASRLVAVPSPLLEISTTHLEVRPDAGAGVAAVITDLASTNGTLLLRTGQPPHELVPGLPTRLVPGDVVDLGEGITIRVQRP